ncbi:hypothetical protein FRC07_013245 [Ceratobasidium sp. 392]|nr:hypothetical protein FRC07_013245 [Ceratobasidium sp. 392]
MYTLNPRHSGSLSVAHLNECIAYRKALSDHCFGQGEHPSVAPRAHQLYRAIMMAEGDKVRPLAEPIPRRAWFTADINGRTTNATASAIQALAAAQEWLQHMLANIISAEWHSQPSVQADVPRIPPGFTGTIKTSLASQIGARGGRPPTAPKGFTPLFGNKTLRLTPQYTPIPCNKQTVRGARGAGRGGKTISASPSLPISSTSARAEPDKPASSGKPDPSKTPGLSSSGPISFEGSTPSVAEDPELDWDIPDYDTEVALF